MIFQGIRTSIAKKPYICVIFQGGSGPPVPPSGSAHENCPTSIQEYGYKSVTMSGSIIAENTIIGHLL